MTTVILIGTVAMIVAIVGCIVIWRMDATRAEEVDHQAPAPQPAHRTGPGLDAPRQAPPRSIEI